MPFEPDFNGHSAASICSKDQCDSAKWKDKYIYDDAHAICTYIIPGMMQDLTKIMYSNSKYGSNSSSILCFRSIKK